MDEYYIWDQEKNEATDSGYYLSPVNIEDINRITEVIKDGNNYSVVSPDSDLPSGEGFFLSDIYFNGESYNLTFDISELGLYVFQHDKDEMLYLYVEFSKIEKTYFEYARNMAHVNENDGNPLTEPVTVYEPVINGLGIIYGINTVIEKMNLLQFDTTLVYF